MALARRGRITRILVRRSGDGGGKDGDDGGNAVHVRIWRRMRGRHLPPGGLSGGLGFLLPLSDPSVLYGMLGRGIHSPRIPDLVGPSLDGLLGGSSSFLITPGGRIAGRLGIVISRGFARSLSLSVGWNPHWKVPLGCSFDFWTDTALPLNPSRTAVGQVWGPQPKQTAGVARRVERGWRVREGR